MLGGGRRDRRSTDGTVLTLPPSKLSYDSKTRDIHYVLMARLLSIMSKARSS